MSEKYLKDYLKGLVRCQDPDKLKEVYGVDENYLILLYGDKEKIFDRILDDFSGHGLKAMDDLWIKTNWDGNQESTYFTYRQDIINMIPPRTEVRGILF